MSRKCLVILIYLLLLEFRQLAGQIGQPGQAPGQVPLSPGYQQPLEPIKNILQGSYANNITLYYRNSPYRVQGGDLTVEYGVTMEIETGTRIYFDTGTGLIVKGTLRAVGNQFAHIEMLPYQQQINYDSEMPKFRLVDGPTVRQGRLQAQFRDRWRSVCTMVTNWTAIDTGVACRSMGYSDGGFWKWFRRNNDTYPFVMPQPDCHHGAQNLWDCPAFSNPDTIRLSENLCQGEDDIGIYCWGPPSFTGWARHWKGVQIYDSPFHYVHSDPDMVAVHKQSNSRLEFVDILYAGYDGVTRNTTSALYIQGVAPIMNGLRIEHSARDGLQLYDVTGPVLIANSTFSFNRGRGVMVDNTTDGRVYLNNSRIDGNWGDGVWYKQKRGVNLMTYGIRERRSIGGKVAEDRPRIDMCQEHHVPKDQFFPHLIVATLRNKTFLDPAQPTPCWMSISLPPRLPYTYSLQWLYISDRNEAETTRTSIVICDAEENACGVERLRVPIRSGVYPQSVALKSSGVPLYIALEHTLPDAQPGYVQADINILFNIHASVIDKAYYGLNVSTCIINDNIGNGIAAYDIRERTALTNVTLDANQGYAGFYVKDGAADIWVNETRILRNWGDGMNVSYAGGAVMVNGTRIEKNRWRGAAFHFNQTIPFFPVHQEIVFKGRPSNNMFYLPTTVSGNEWGGILVGNFSWGFPGFPSPREAFPRPRVEPKILISWVEFSRNLYHPALEIFSCRDPSAPKTYVDVTGNKIEGNLGYGLRISPAVNIQAVISSNQFLNNNDTALYIRNAQWPELSALPADVTISKNAFKFNHAKYIISLGLNEDAPNQGLIFNQQNEIRANQVFDPFPNLPPRSTPYAALVVSSSNVRIHRNCFKNEHARFEIGTELEEHAKIIDARENNWGSPVIAEFIDKVFDQFNRYSLARIDIDPFMAVCNQRVPHITPQNEVFRKFRKDSEAKRLGGMIYENHDLMRGRYEVVEDLQVVPGAKLTIASGSVLEFQHGIGMLVQGDLIRNEFESDDQVIFTSAPFSLMSRTNIRLVDPDGNDQVTEGRLEVYLDNQWGTVCNRSWTPELTILACNQLGLIADVQYFENWRIFPTAGDLPMIMDNIRCEENEIDITRCRHDGVERNCAAGCRSSEVVGLRCLEPRWAGVRYSLLANPPTVTGQTTMDNWLIEKAGLFNFRTSEFCAAFSIDWNYHTFNRLEIRNNFWDGMDIIYNDLIKKPAIRHSKIINNRRNGIHIRSAGITIENVTISENGQSGMRYNPKISSLGQNDIVTWLDMTEQPELEANNIFEIPNRDLDFIEVLESNLNQRKFLVAKSNLDCPENPKDLCVYNLMIRASGFEYGMSSKMAVQIVNPASNVSDEDAVFTEVSTGKTWSVRKDQVEFPIVSTRNEMRMRYTRSYGTPKLVILILFLDTQEYLDRFIHIYKSRIDNNQYGISTVHYSNLTFSDGSLSNRWQNEKIWMQKVNFTRNSEAVIWINSPQFQVLPNTPTCEIFYHLDNCSIIENTGPIIEYHKDLFASANVFKWNLWSNTFANNSRSGISVQLPDSYDILARPKMSHEFLMTENRFETNHDFKILVEGYYAFLNISSNNFTSNLAPRNFGILELRGMEKKLIFERNRFFENFGNWMLKIDTTSQYLQDPLEIPGFVRYNYLEKNRFLEPSRNVEYVDMWPRSYAVGIFGSQKINIHFNRFQNILMDFELVSGCKYSTVYDTMNVTYNWWGTGNEATIAQRIFDFDDWNIFMLTKWSPFYVTNDLFINFWWKPLVDGQLAEAGPYVEPTISDLKGRVYEDKNMTLIEERWYNFPHYYRPFRPYFIFRDVTIMPGATLYIQPGVEVHIWPNVRILVLGNLIADGTYWQPIRFKPVNTTELAEFKGRITTEYRKRRKREAAPDFGYVLDAPEASPELVEPSKSFDEFFGSSGSSRGLIRSFRGSVEPPGTSQEHTESSPGSHRLPRASESAPEALHSPGTSRRLLGSSESAPGHPESSPGSQEPPGHPGASPESLHPPGTSRGSRQPSGQLGTSRGSRQPSGRPGTSRGLLEDSQERPGAPGASPEALHPPGTSRGSQEPPEPPRSPRSHRSTDRSRPDSIYRQFPTLHRDDPYYQRFSISLNLTNPADPRAGWLQIYNSTTGEIVPSCDQQFTIRNAQVVCRELGFDTMNVYHWVTPRWDYKPELRILKTYMEPRECRGDEERLDRCNLRLSGNLSLWQCKTSEFFNYIYCGKARSLRKEYIGNWGGVAFGDATLEGARTPETSLLRNVEIVGGGAGHNDSWASGGLQIFHRSPILDRVNVTNSSMAGVQIFAPRNKIVMANLNVTDNLGQGVNIMTAFVQAPNAQQETMRRPLTLPYYTQGMLDMCAAQKSITVKNRIMLYYKYDSVPVDCVKIFRAVSGRPIAFRLIQYHLYSSPTDLGRSDVLQIFGADTFTGTSKLAEFRQDPSRSSDPSKPVSSETLAIHLRATAADGIYGFIAEVSALPSTPEAENVAEVVIRNSRIDRNDRGAIEYSNCGEMSPPLVIEDSSMSFNGIHLFGNISTSSQAVQLNLHNTLLLLFRSNSLAHNQGGLYISATSSSPVARLQALVKNCLFAYNSNSTTIALAGNNYQVVTFLNNIISHNYALFHDTVVCHDVAINMTKNTVFENVGLHTVDLRGNSRTTSDKNVFQYNHFYENLALGHGHQYVEMYGYQPMRENNEFLNRPRRRKRQVLTQQGISFDWWTHVDNETTRYRSTIVAGSPMDVFHFNTFNDPKNDYELTSSKQSQYEIGTSLDARNNYWGYPGTIGVASGKIRDQEDYPYLSRVNYSPVLESNTSLVEGDCPAGWFQAGHQEFKSCFLYVAAAVTYQHAVEYCEELDAFVPYLRADDVRQKQLAMRIDEMGRAFITDAERIAAYGVDDDVNVWISSVHVPSIQCGRLSARTNRIGTVNCNLLLPFVCEKGTQPYSEPILWRNGMVISIVIAGISLFLLILLLICWWIKSRSRRSESHVVRQASMKLQKKHQASTIYEATHESAHASLASRSRSSAHYTRRSPTETVSTYADMRKPYAETSNYTYAGYGSSAGSSNPYSEISETTVKMRDDLRSCSTCTVDSGSERTSTATDMSASSYSTTSISTVQNHPIPPIRRSNHQNPPSTSTRRSYHVIETSM